MHPIVERMPFVNIPCALQWILRLIMNLSLFTIQFKATACRVMHCCFTISKPQQNYHAKLWEVRRSSFSDIKTLGESPVKSITRPTPSSGGSDLCHWSLVCANTQPCRRLFCTSEARPSSSRTGTLAIPSSRSKNLSDCEFHCLAEVRKKTRHTDLCWACVLSHRQAYR